MVINVSTSNNLNFLTVVDLFLQSKVLGVQLPQNLISGNTCDFSWSEIKSENT